MMMTMKVITESSLIILKGDAGTAALIKKVFDGDNGDGTIAIVTIKNLLYQGSSARVSLQNDERRLGNYLHGHHHNNN